MRFLSAAGPRGSFNGMDVTVKSSKSFVGTKTGMEKTEGKAVPVIAEATVEPAGVGRLIELEEQDYAYVKPQPRSLASKACIGSLSKG